MDQAAGRGVAAAQAHIIDDEIAAQRARAKFNLGRLIRLLEAARLVLMERKLFLNVFFAFKLSISIQNPCVRRASVKYTSHLLWRIADKEISDVDIVRQVSGRHMNLQRLAIIVHRTFGDVVDLDIVFMQQLKHTSVSDLAANGLLIHEQGLSERHGRLRLQCFGQLDLRIAAAGGGQVDWFAVRADVARLFGQLLLRELLDLNRRRWAN